MERIEMLRVLRDLARGSLDTTQMIDLRVKQPDITIGNPTSSAHAQAPSAHAHSAPTSTATASANVTDAKQFLAGFADEHEKDQGPISERRDRTSVRLRRSEDRKAFAAAGM
jgi:hypothetical protein